MFCAFTVQNRLDLANAMALMSQHPKAKSNTSKKVLFS